MVGALPARRMLRHMIIHVVHTCCVSGSLASRTVLSLLVWDLCRLPRCVSDYRMGVCFGARSVTLLLLARAVEMQWTYSGTGVFAAVWMLMQISVPALISGLNVF